MGRVCKHLPAGAIEVSRYSTLDYYIPVNY